MNKNSSWTGIAPRTMRDAFNPYTSDDLQPMRDDRDYSVGWWCWIIAIAVATVTIIGWTL